MAHLYICPRHRLSPQEEEEAVTQGTFWMDSRQFSGQYHCMRVQSHSVMFNSLQPHGL